MSLPSSVIDAFTVTDSKYSGATCDCLMLKILGYSTLGFSANEKEEQRVILTIPVPYIVPATKGLYKELVHSAGPFLNWKKLEDEALIRDSIQNESITMI